MKHLKKILAICITIAILCSAAVGVGATGVIFYNHDSGCYDDEDYRILNDWLINTPYWAVDIFVPGYTTQHLRNDPKADGKTIDFEITPYEGFKETVIVADIPEEYRDIHNKLVSEMIQDPDVNIAIKNIVRNKTNFEFDYFATGYFGGVWNDSKVGPYFIQTKNVSFYGVLSDKKTGEIIRYDWVDELRMNVETGTCYYPSKTIADPDFAHASIEIPEDFNPEEYEYGFCAISFDLLEINYAKIEATVYDGEAQMYNYTKVDVPEEIYVEPVIILGDVNDDGRVNISDASLLLKHLAYWNVKIKYIQSDMNSDGKVNTSDVSAILKKIAGWKVY